jgi:PAS domain S-box-containing protein
MGIGNWFAPHPVLREFLQRLAGIGFGALTALLWSPCVLALDPSLDISQYAHTSWTFRNGFLNGAVYAIAQTPDGYIWFGTQSGVVRFDGVRVAPLPLAPGQLLPSTAVGSLLAARDGTLWIGTFSGLASWKDGRLTEYPALALQSVIALVEDRDGAVWAGGFGSPTGKLCAIRSGTATCYGDDGRFGAAVASLYQDAGGSLWVGAATGLWRWSPGPPTRISATPIPNSQGFAQGDGGSGALVAIDSIQKIAGTKLVNYPLRGAPSPLTARSLLRDRSGALWIGTAAHGIVHSYQGKTSLFTHADGLSSDLVVSLFEDREGSVWAATPNGLDEFRESPVGSLSASNGLSSTTATSILAARDGSIWIGTADGLNRWKDGRMTIYRTRSDPGLPDDSIQSLFEDERGRIWVSGFRGLAVFENGRFSAVTSVPPGFVHAMASDNHDGLWLSMWLTANDYGVAHLTGGKIVEHVSWQNVGGGPGTGLVPELDGSVWTGLLSGGIASVRAGEIRNVSLGDDRSGARRVLDLSRDRNGALWVAAENGLSRVKDGSVATLTTANGLPCNAVHWIVEDDMSSYWLYTRCGLVRIARAEMEAWTVDPKRTIQATVFDTADGVRPIATLKGFRPAVTKASDGKIWFLNGDNVSVIDPARIGVNTLPVPVHIEQITADDKPYDPKSGLRLPANVRNLRIDYTALSMIAPEKIHFKYKLEGQNRNWHEVINERAAKYTNLSPGNYHFRVTASNSSGVWNETGDTLEFSIAPAYYQTNWFRALIAAGALSLLWTAYRFRVRRLHRESRQLRDVIETIPAYVWSAQPDGSVDFINRRWLEFSGLSMHQALGWGWIDAVHPEDRARLLEDWRAAVASGEAMESEARMRRADGQYRWMLVRSVPQRDRIGKIVKWYGKSTDIDDRKRAEETLRESETRFRTFVDQATDAFFVLEFEHGTILDVNRRACENLGYTREELIGQSIFLFDVHFDPEFLDQNVRPAMEAGETMTFETRHRRKDGSEFPVEIRARTFHYQGRLVNLSLALDITERKRAEEEHESLRQLEADLAHINRVSMMGELATSIAHEVNQPLTGIVSNGSACLRWMDGDSPNLEEVREAVRDIVRDGKRAGEVIARIRALTKRTPAPKDLLDLNQTIIDVLAIVGDEAKRASVVIQTQFADNLSPVSGDRVQLQQVLLNLIMNGLEAMSSVNERVRRLIITTQNVDPGQVQVTVEDSGIGLDPNTMSRIFEPFFTTKAGGMGMGLSISRTILENHGGRLWATANDGAGTNFHFTLPEYQEQHAGSGK